MPSQTIGFRSRSRADSTLKLQQRRTLVNNPTHWSLRQAINPRVALFATALLQVVISLATNTSANASNGTVNDLWFPTEGTRLESTTQDKGGIRVLEPGKPIEQDVSGGQVRSYQIMLVSGQYLRVAVEERGIDVVVGLFGPDSKKIIEVDSPNETQATEKLAFTVDTVGSYRLDVRPLRKDAARGRFEIRIEELRAETEKDKTLIAAERTIMQAEALRSKKTAESRAQAIEKYQEAQNLYRDASDRSGMVATMVGIGKAYYALGEKPKAIESYNQAAVVYRDLKDQKNESAILHRIGIIYDELGEREKAIDSLKSALKLRRSLPDDAATAATLYYLGTVYNDLKDWEAALKNLNEALPLHRNAGDKPGEAITSNYLGDIYLFLGNTEQALKSYERALTIRHDLGNHEGEANTLKDLGILHLSLGETQEALSRFERARLLVRDLNAPLLKAKILVGLGMTYSTVSDSIQALKCFSEASVLAQEGGDDETLAMALTTMGMLYAKMGDSENALKQYERAEPLIKKFNDPGAEAARLFAVGVLHISRKEFTKSLSSFAQASVLAARVGDTRTARWCSIFVGISYFMLDQSQKARDELKSVLPALRAIGDRQYLSLALGALAAVERDDGDLVSALKYIEEAISVLESLRGSVVSQDLRISFFADVQAYFEVYLDILMRLYRQSSREEFQARALEVNERARARSLLELLTEARTDIREGVNPALLKRERSLRQELNARADSRLRLLSGMFTPAKAVATANEIEALTVAYREVQAEIRQQSPRYANLTRPPSLSIQQIQAQLDPDTILLEYALGEETSYLWLVSQTTVESYELPGRSEIETAARSFYEFLAVETDPGNQEMAQRASRLSRMLLGQVSSRLGQKRLVIVAPGALQTLPFAALPDPVQVRPDTGTIQPLIVQHEIVSLPSMSVLATLRTELTGRQRAPRELIVLADPVFSAADERVHKKAPATRSNPLSPAGGKNATSPAPQATVAPSSKFPDRLQGTRNEAEGIVAFARANSTRRVLDFEAGREIVNSGELGNYRYVHFATHGMLDNLHPELSAIVLSLVDKNGNPRNGYLRVNEIYNLNLPADLVVLSACETGLGKDVKGEGLIGLTRGFMYAGAPRVIVSLWAVRDESTAGLMISLYRSMLKEGKRPAAALRSAQLEMLKSGRWRAPYYWAAFVLQGEWNSN